MKTKPIDIHTQILWAIFSLAFAVLFSMHRGTSPLDTALNRKSADLSSSISGQ